MEVIPEPDQITNVIYACTFPTHLASANPFSAFTTSGWCVLSSKMHKLVSVGSLFVVKLMFEACVAGPPAATITSSAMECSVGIGKSKFT